MDVPLRHFLNGWASDPNGVKDVFLTLLRFLKKTDALKLDFKSRPGVSHSLRAQHARQTRPLFVLIDIIDDDPSARWLSICFYADLITDPEHKGDLVPGGLFGEDAYCFDCEDAVLGPYLFDRLAEACACAAGAVNP